VLTSTIIFKHFEPGRLAKSPIDVKIEIPDPQGAGACSSPQALF